jgi:glucan phosphoethanolaminetransferase (alkaline phosphatase superfamily)
MKKFASKIDLWFVMLLSLVFGIILTIFAFDENWIIFSILVLVIIFIAHMFATTFYVVNDEKVIIKSGFFFNLSIKIKDIKRISKSNNIISSPALSFNRLEILYNKFDTILISPKDKEGFIKALKIINQEIEVN